MAEYAPHRSQPLPGLGPAGTHRRARITAAVQYGRIRTAYEIHNLVFLSVLCAVCCVLRLLLLLLLPHAAAAALGT